MWRNWTPYALLVGIENVTATVENSMTVPQELKNRYTIGSINHHWVWNILSNWLAT